MVLLTNQNMTEAGPLGCDGVVVMSLAKPQTLFVFSYKPVLLEKLS